MLTREKLTKDEWTAVRNTPHLVTLAVSGVGGSPLDEMLERRAGLQGVAETMHSTHPLLREIADASQILQAQDAIRSWYYKLADAQRNPARLQEEALESMRRALDAIAAHGDREDLILYRDFVLATATRVARAAREGDILGVGGKLVSSGESDFIARLEGIAATAAA